MRQDVETRCRYLGEKLRAILNESQGLGVGQIYSQNRNIFPIVHLFGITYALDLDGIGLAEAEFIASRAGLPRSHGTMIRNGRDLRPYVDIKPEHPPLAANEVQRMDEHTKALIEKLHVPFDKDLAEEVEIPYTYKDGFGELHHETETRVQFPDRMYEKRLDDVFGLNWQNKISLVHYFGMNYWDCTLTVKLSEDKSISRAALQGASTSHVVASACEMLGIGGIGISGRLYCTRRLNEKFGFDWNYKIRWEDEHEMISGSGSFHCEIEVNLADGDCIIRTAVGEDSEKAFVRACGLFGIDPNGAS